MNHGRMNDRINEQNMKRKENTEQEAKENPIPDTNSLRTLEEIKIELELSLDDPAANCIGGNQNYVTQTTKRINNIISTGDIDQSSKNDKEEKFEVSRDKRNNANKSI